ncbi:MAG TPA: WG repeat-containing protein [Chitinophagaceae bacterium]|nr:WG repeat-containing protein [Chitinophagaceae bacterium]
MLSLSAVSQKNKDFLLSYTDSSSGLALYGYKTANGKIIISAKDNFSYTDTMYSMAIVLKNSSWVGIDRKGNTILAPFIFDNGPDYIEQGLFRFVENNKIVFATINGNKLIPAKFDFAEPFQNGISEYRNIVWVATGSLIKAEYMGGERGNSRGAIVRTFQK